ncbi:MAG: Crp/Fnr family transcriptional regulator [Ignavibacteriaceae bacterium]
MKELKNFLSNYINMPDEVMENITNRFKLRSLKKNEYLMQQGEICKNLVFVRSGCLRLYYVANDVEVSVWFAFANNSAIEISSFISQKPSNYFLQAIEESEILYLPKTELDVLYKIYPAMQEMMRRYWEDVVINLIDRFTALQRDPAEKRYLDLTDKPEYLQKIPQKYLASFIGVTPTSLSRIRKNIITKN